LARHFVRVLTATVYSTVLLGGSSCGNASEGGGGTDFSTPRLFVTCGDPVCRGYEGPFDGVSLCNDEGMQVGVTHATKLARRVTPSMAATRWSCASDLPWKN
jgi:hypothetical protein